MKKRSMFADGLMKANDWMDEPAGQETLLIGQALTMFMAGLLMGINDALKSIERHNGKWGIS